MTEADNSISNPDAPQIEHRASEPQQTSLSRKTLLGVGAFGILAMSLAMSLAGSAAAWSASRHQDVSFDTNLASTPIAKLADASSIGVTGQVAEIYGNKFVVTDGTARALVETGPAGEGGKLVSPNETVTVQGRFHNGFLHAAAIRHADQRIEELDPPPPSPRPAPPAPPATAADAPQPAGEAPAPAPAN